uniref:Tetratricopeptide repeat-containing protein n=1 Tax=Rhizochromulina marina TaxID=1034831 RepID=A0A7S2R6W5_9STRA
MAEMHFYLREGLRGHLLGLTTRLRERRGDDSRVVFWQAFAKANNGMLSDALEMFERLRGKRGYELACLHALLFFYRTQKREDLQTIEGLTLAAEMAVETASDACLLNSAHVLWHMGDVDAGIQMLQRMSCRELVVPSTEAIPAEAHSQLSIKAAILRGWMEMSNGIWRRNDLSHRLEILALFSSCVNSSEDGLDALLGIARVHELHEDWDAAGDALSSAIARSPSFAPALVEKARLLLAKGDWEQALATTSRVLVQDPDNVQALRLQCLSLIQHGPRATVSPRRASVGEGEVAGEEHDGLEEEQSTTAQEAQAVVKDKVGALATALKQRESQNALLFLSTAELLSRALVSTHLRPVLAMCEDMAAHALSLIDKDDNEVRSAFLTELGNQQLLANRVEEAMSVFREASMADAGNFQALYGMIHCQLLVGQASDASDQLELLKAMQDDAQEDPRLLYLQALLLANTPRDSETLTSSLERNGLLEQTMDLRRHDVSFLSGSPPPVQASCSYGSVAALHRQAATTTTPSRQPRIWWAFTSAFERALVAFEPVLALHVAELMVSDVDVDVAALSPLIRSIAQSNMDAAVLRRTLRLLQEVLWYVPSAPAPRLLAAKVQLFLDQEHPHLATDLIEEALRFSPWNTDAHLCLASLVLEFKKDFASGAQSLDQTLSFDLSAQRRPVYRVLRARVLAANGWEDAALKQLEIAASTTPGLLPGLVPLSTDSPSEDPPAVASEDLTPLAEKVLFALEFTGCLLALDRISEALRLCKSVKRLCRDTMFEEVLTLRESDVLVQRGEAEVAIRLLKHISADSPAYVYARHTLADIYLVKRRDKAKFCEVHESLVTQGRPSPTKAALALGEAMLRIQNPERAVLAFQQALEWDPTQTMLAVRIGRTLISTHDYRRAKDYYEAALQGSRLNPADALPLQLDLAQLLLKLRQYPEAIKVIHASLRHRPGQYGGEVRISESAGAGGRLLEGEATAESMASEVQALLLLAEAHEQSGQGGLSLDTSDPSMAALLRCKELQLRVVGLQKNKAQEKAIFSDICLRLAGLCQAIGESSRSQRHPEEKGDMDAPKQKVSGSAMALEFLQEALRVHTDCEPAILSIAKTDVKRGDLALATQRCEILVRIDGGMKNAAIIMLADIAFVQEEFARATELLKELLSRAPNHYPALSRLIELLRRADELKHGVEFLRRAEKAHPRAFSHPGLHYCKGVYFRACNQPHEAIHFLNKGRRDGEWGRRCLGLMILTYIEPIHDTIMSSAEDVQVEKQRQAESHPEPRAESQGGPQEVDDAQAVHIAQSLLREYTFPAAGSAGETASAAATGAHASTKRRTMMEEGVGGVALGATDEASGNKDSLDTCLRAAVDLARLFVEGVAKQHDPCTVEEQVHTVTKNLLAVVERDPTYVPAMVYLAVMFMLQKQEQKARNMLKKVAKMPYMYEHGDAFEVAYLNLAVYYITKSKYDLAQDLCKRCLKFNKSSAKAYETLGSILERELAYKDAAENYEKAWEYCMQGSPSIGYKLAFNYLKAKRFVEAIDVANEVAKKFPHYPRVKEEVLFNAFGQLRL